MHGQSNARCYQPCTDNPDVGERVLASAVTDGAIEGMEPVNADTNEAVDGGRTEKNICSDPGLAHGDSHPPAFWVQ